MSVPQKGSGTFFGTDSTILDTHDTSKNVSTM